MNRGRSSLVFVGFAAMAAVACPLAAGCMAADGEDITSQDSFDVPMTALTGGGDPDDPPTGPNGDDPEGVNEQETQNALYEMSKFALISSVGPNNEPYMRNHPEVSVAGRKFLKSAVRCALTSQYNVTDPVTNELYEGWWGLAPDWRTRPLTETETRWVSACMIQKLNAYGAPVKILLQGNHPAIEHNATLASTYPYIEATAFGNLFLGSGNTVMFISWFDQLATACGDPAAALAKRICDTSVEACNATILSGGYAVPNGHYFEFPDFGYTEAITVRLKTEDISCYGTD